MSAKDIKVLKKNRDGSFSDAEVEVRDEEHDVLIITTIPIDIRLEISDDEF